MSGIPKMYQTGNTFYMVVRKDDLYPEELLNSQVFMPEYYDNYNYYRFISFLIGLFRDVIEPVSIYRFTDETDEHIEDWINTLGENYDSRLADILREYQAPLMNIAIRLAKREPRGIYERLDYYEHDRYTVKFVGIVHSSDYR